LAQIRTTTAEIRFFSRGCLLLVHPVGLYHANVFQIIDITLM